jgi:integrase
VREAAGGLAGRGKDEDFAARDDGLYVETGKRGKRLLFSWSASLAAAWDEAKALRRRPSESRLFPISESGFKTAWSRAMHAWQPEDVAARFAENDLRAKVAGQALDQGMDAASLLGHSSDAVTRRHYVRGTRKVVSLG